MPMWFCRNIKAVLTMLPFMYSAGAEYTGARLVCLRKGLYLCIILVCLYVVIQNSYINKTIQHRHRVFTDTLNNASKLHFPCQRKFWNTIYMFMVSGLGQTTKGKEAVDPSPVNIRNYVDSKLKTRDVIRDTITDSNLSWTNSSYEAARKLHPLKDSNEVIATEVKTAKASHATVKESLRPLSHRTVDVKYTHQSPLPPVPGDFNDALHNRSKSNTTDVILSVVDESYVEFAVNFHETSIRKFNLEKRFLMICLDRQTKVVLRQRGLDCYNYISSFVPRLGSTKSRGDFGTAGYYLKTNLKTLVVLQALKLGYTILVVDLDIVFFKDPFQYFTCNDCDLHIQMDRVHLNSGFVYIKPTPASIMLYSLAWQEYVYYQKSHDQAYLNMAVTIMGNWNHTIRIKTLSPQMFPCGTYYFVSPTFRRVFGEHACTECVVVHNNYIGSIAAKEYRFKENKLWVADFDGYYSNPAAKYLLYDNPMFFGHKTLDFEKKALQSALAIGHITGRIVILPAFHCCDCETSKCFPKIHRCSLLSLLKLRTFDSIFKGKYREHSFLNHSKVPEHIKNILNLPSKKVFKIKTDMESNVNNASNNIIEFLPEASSSGATSDEISKWFAPFSEEPILVFQALYNSFSKFSDAQMQLQFANKIKEAFQCSSYEQWEVRSNFKV